jgi:hypothetical protein
VLLLSLQAEFLTYSLRNFEQISYINFSLFLTQVYRDAYNIVMHLFLFVSSVT